MLRNYIGSLRESGLSMNDDLRQKVSLFEELLGFSRLARTVAHALSTPLDEVVVQEMDALYNATRDERFLPSAVSEELHQLFYDRFVVVSTPLFVPLVEGSVRRAHDSGASTTFGPLTSTYTDHVVACYKLVGFDYTQVPVSPLVPQARHADSMVCELAFMATLADLSAHDAPDANRALSLLGEFAKTHAGAWFQKASGYVSAKGEDMYSRLVSVAADLAESAMDLAETKIDS